MIACPKHARCWLPRLTPAWYLLHQVNVATALHRLARLHCTSASSNAASVIVTSDQFRLLLAAIRKLLPRFEVYQRGFSLQPAQLLTSAQKSRDTDM